MKRILIGLIVAAVLGAGGWFGFNFYAKHRATAEVEAEPSARGEHEECHQPDQDSLHSAAPVARF